MTGPLKNGEDFAGLDEDLTLGNCGAHHDGIACGREAGHNGKHAAHCSDRMHEVIEWDSRPPGRPPVADKRVKRGVRWNNEEWAEVKRRAAKASMTIGAYVRSLTCGTLLLLALALAGCVADADGDGFLGPQAGGDDCDDTDPDVHPEAEELCNVMDDDCNGAIPAWEFIDDDVDGYPNCVDCEPDDSGWPDAGGDCETTL